MKSLCPDRAVRKGRVWVVQKDGKLYNVTRTDQRLQRRLISTQEQFRIKSGTKVAVEKFRVLKTRERVKRWDERLY